MDSLTGIAFHLDEASASLSSPLSLLSSFLQTAVNVRLVLPRHLSFLPFLCLFSITHAYLSSLVLSLSLCLSAHSNGRFKSKMKAPGSLMRLASTRDAASDDRRFDILRWRANKKNRTGFLFLSFLFSFSSREKFGRRVSFRESSVREDIYISESRIRRFVRFIRSSAHPWFLTRTERYCICRFIYCEKEIFEIFYWFHLSEEVRCRILHMKRVNKSENYFPREYNKIPWLIDLCDFWNYLSSMCPHKLLNMKKVQKNNLLIIIIVESHCDWLNIIDVKCPDSMN